MSRYIDADKLITYIKEIPKIDRFAKYWIGEEATWVPFLESFPTADVRENVRGKWVKYGKKWTCDKCGELVYDDDHNFCPNCGAYMRGDNVSRD